MSRLSTTAPTRSRPRVLIGLLAAAVGAVLALSGTAQRLFSYDDPDWWIETVSLANVSCNEDQHTTTFSNGVLYRASKACEGYGSDGRRIYCSSFHEHFHADTPPNYTNREWGCSVDIPNVPGNPDSPTTSCQRSVEVDGPDGSPPVDGGWNPHDCRWDLPLCAQPHDPCGESSQNACERLTEKVKKLKKKLKKADTPAEKEKIKEKLKEAKEDKQEACEDG